MPENQISSFHVALSGSSLFWSKPANVKAIIMGYYVKYKRPVGPHWCDMIALAATVGPWILVTVPREYN